MKHQRPTTAQPHRPRRPKCPKNPIPRRNNPTVTTRVKNAISYARTILKAFKKGDQEKVTEATILTGILAGDVTAASVATKLRLQKENLRLRQLLTRSRLKTEALKQRISTKEADLLEKPKLTEEERNKLVYTKVRGIYGLTEQTE